jgi:lipopolysaccharide export system protein LptC
MQKTSIIYLGVLAILALLSYGLLLEVRSSLQPPKPLDEQTPVLTMDNALATRMNEQGQREYTLSAVHALQRPEPRGSWLEQPVFTLFQDESIAWLLHAERAWVSSDYELIRLEGDVSLNRPATTGKPVLITTPKAWIRPAENYVETAEIVHMETPDGVLTSVGAKAYLREQQVELLSEVRGNYVPSHQP